MATDITDRDAQNVNDALTTFNIDGLKPSVRHVRVPQQAVPMPGRAYDHSLLEDWIVGGYIVDCMRLWKNPPCVSELTEVSGRSHARIMASLGRMQRRGWLGMKKLRHEYEPGKFGHRWRIWLTDVSPLRELRDGQLAWIALPDPIARRKSTIAAAVFLVAHEQKRIDGAVSTTPTDLAALVGCDTRTAQRALVFIGAVPLIECRPGRVLYDLPMVYDRKLARTFDLLGEEVQVRGNATRFAARWQLLNGTLTAAGVNVRAEYQRAITDLKLRGIDLRVDLLMRLMEERHRRVLMRSDAYRPRLMARLGWRLRGGVRRLSRAERDEFAAVTTVQRRERDEARDVFTAALRDTCGTCDGVRQVETVEQRDHGPVTVWVRCVDCT